MTSATSWRWTLLVATLAGGKVRASTVAGPSWAPPHLRVIRAPRCR